MGFWGFGDERSESGIDQEYDSPSIANLYLYYEMMYFCTL